MSIANSAGISRRGTISASTSATAGPTPSRAGSPSCMSTPTGAKTPSATAPCATPPTGSPTCCARWRQSRRPRRHHAPSNAGSRSRAHRDLQARRRRAADRRPVRPRCAVLPPAEFWRQGADDQRAGLAKLDGVRGEVPDLATASSRSMAHGRPRLPTLARASSDFAPVDTTADDPAHDDLHLGDHRPAEGRAARASRSARPLARHRTAAFSIPTGRATATGRPPTGPGPAACSMRCCRACIAACRWWRAASTSSIRTRPSR